MFPLTVSLAPTDMNPVPMIEESPTEARRDQFIDRVSALSSGFVRYIKVSLIALGLLLFSLV